MIRRRQTVLLVFCAVLALGARASLDASGAGAAVATLKKIASKVDGRAGVISIEASDPVPYVASQPDPRTFVVELRDVEAAGFADNFKPDPRHPIAAVQVEAGQAPDGATVARVRMLLSQPMRPRVRSSRNVIFVEADRLDRGASAVGTTIGGPSSAIRDVRVSKRGNGMAVTLRATGTLTVATVDTPKIGPPQLVIDLANATSALPGTTMVGQDPVNTVRIGINQDTPLLTRVIMDLTRRAAYRLEPSADGNDLTVVFEDQAQVPPTQLALAQQQPPPAQNPTPLPPAPQAPTAPAPPAAGTGQQPTIATPTQTRFTGVPISLDFQGADLRAVLRTFAEISGLNIVIDPSIQGTVDVALRDVPWDQALDIILRANRLGYVVDGTIVRIAPLSVLADEEAQRQKLAEAQALAGTLETRTFALSYARAEQLQPLLTATVLSQRGSTQTDVRSNTLIITDLPERLARAAELLTTLDRPEPQVEIEARIVQTSRDFARRIGIQWGFNGRAVPELGNTLPLAFPNQAQIGGRTGSTQGPPGQTPATETVPGVVNLGITPAATGIGLALGSINGAFNLDVALSALEETGQGRLLSTPRVTTQNNIEAQITQGVQIPIQTVANNTVTVTFRDAALTLLVTPQITAANTVIMRITVENASPDFSRAVNNIPPINTQRAITQVLVSNGETTVIGGIYVSNEQTEQDRTPGLYRLPLLGWLFQRNTFSEESRELLIFITPRIIRL